MITTQSGFLRIHQNTLFQAVPCAQAQLRRKQAQLVAVTQLQGESGQAKVRQIYLCHRWPLCPFQATEFNASIKHWVEAELVYRCYSLLTVVQAQAHTPGFTSLLPAQLIYSHKHGTLTMCTLQRKAVQTRAASRVTMSKQESQEASKQGSQEASKQSSLAPCTRWINQDCLFNHERTLTMSIIHTQQVYWCLLTGFTRDGHKDEAGRKRV